MRKDAIFAIIGFLIGAAAIAGGDENDDLRDELRALQREAARAQLHDWDGADVPPVDDRGNQLGIFRIDDLSTPRPWFLPGLDLVVFEDDESPPFGGQAEEGYLTFGTGEEILELLRATVSPDSWEEGYMSIDCGTLLTMTAPNTNGLVREALDARLRPLAHRGVCVDFEVLEVGADIARRLRALDGGVLNNAQRTSLNEAVKAGSAKRTIALRGTGTQGVQFTVTHGREIAFLGDLDVEVAQTASTADPVVQVTQEGGQLAVRAVADQPGNVLRLGLDLRMRELQEIRRHETRQSGVLDQPQFQTQSTKVTLSVPEGAWVVAFAGNGAPGMHRVFLVRGRVLNRMANGGGVR